MMTEARKLLKWHEAKQKIKVVQKQMDELKQREAELTAKRKEAEEKIRSIGTPAEDDIDGKIALALAQQELWLVDKDSERLFEEKFEKEFSLRESKREWEEKIKEYEESLSGEALALYNKVGENVENPVVEVRRRSCMGCFLPLSVVKMEEWHKGRSLVTCDECGRILV
jgi:predicted  nucleic acid-binding Zn-ribbon protein